MDRQYYDNSEIEIDLIDLCKVFLANIKWIVLAAVIGLAVGLGGAALKKTPTPLSVEEKKEAVLESLTDSEITYVEGLYNSCDALMKSVTSSQRQIETLQPAADDPMDLVMKQESFALETDVFGLNEQFANYLLSSDDMAELSTILYGTPDQPEKVNRRVYVWIPNDGRTYWNSSTDTTEISDFRQILMLQVFAESKDKADKAVTYLEKVLTEKQTAYAGKNVNFTLTKLDDFYSETQDVIIQKINSRADQIAKDMYNAEYQLNVLNTNYVSKLTGDSKAYYEILSGSYKATAGSKSYKKYGLLGLLLGLFAALGWICVKYVLSNTVKTASELAWVMKGDLPYDLSADGKKKASGDAAKLAAEDLLIKEAKNDIKKLYVITDGDTENNADLQAVISGLKAGVPVTCGNPLASAEALRELSEADGAVITAALKQRKRSDIAQIEQYCRNSGAKILGVIALCDI